MSTTINLTGIAHGGEALGHHQGKVVFVPYAIPGETVEVEIITEKERWARARLVRVIEASPDRVEPPCPWFGPGQCGGCHWQHIAYERQLALKAEVMADQLHRLGRITNPSIADTVALANDDGLLDLAYRNSSLLVADEAGQLGFLRDSERRDDSITGQKRPLDVVAVDRCLLLHPLVDELHVALNEGLAAPAEPLEVADEADADQRPVMLRRVSLRAGIDTGQQLMVLETIGGRAPAFVVEELAVHCALKGRDGAIEPLIGEPWLEEVVAERAFRISAASSFPANTVGAQAMVELALEMLNPAGHETLLDIYSGVGLFALSLARSVGHVIAIEESETPCDDFAWNARDIDNVALYEGPAADVLASIELSEHLHFAAINPPRSGTPAEVVAQLQRLAIPRLLYVSDDPATLARDARLLVEAGYQLEQVQPLDMFPQTYHLDSLTLFTASAKLLATRPDVTPEG